MNAANPGPELRAWQERIRKAREVFEEKVKAADSGVTSLYRVPKKEGIPDFRTDPDGFQAYAQELMERHWAHGTRNWSSATGDYLETIIRREDVLPHIQKLKELKSSGDLRKIVCDSLKGASEEEIEFATRMLEARVDFLDDFFKKKFRSVPDTAMLRSVSPPRAFHVNTDRFPLQPRRLAA